MKTDVYYQWQNDSSESVDFSDVQIMGKFAGRVMPNLDFNVAVFFDVSYLENGIRQLYTYNGRLIGSRV